MNKKEYTQKVKEALVDVTPYDILTFNSREEEQAYIDKKTSEFDITKNLLDIDDGDGIIALTDDKMYSVVPVFIHDDAFVKLFEFIDGKKHFCRPDIIEYFNKQGYVLIRLTNHDGVKGFDSYIPEKLTDYQIRTLERISRELGSVYRELEDTDEYNAHNIKYGIRTIRESIQNSTLIKKRD